MRILLCPADAAGCGYYRVFQPARVLSDEPDLEVGFTRALPLIQNEQTGVIEDVSPLGCDVLVLQRPVYSWMVQAIPMVQRQGVAVVVEVDDDFMALDARNSAWGAVNGRDMSWRNIGAACARADLVTCSSPALAARYGAHGRVAVIPNYVPEALLSIDPCGDGRTVGWSGDVRHHPGDLEATYGGVAMALRDTGARMMVIGPGDGVELRLGLREAVDATGWLALSDYHAALARLDVGIVPLADTAFNRAKSWLKGLEMAAVGVPFVASHRDEYEKLALAGAGVLATDRSRGWRRLVGKLLSDESLRGEVAAQARAVVAARFTIERNGHVWAEAWERAALGARV